MATVAIGSKLPNGLILHHPDKPAAKFTLKGLSSTKIIGATYVLTEIDADFWAAWKAKNATFKALKSGAIFEAKSASDANAISRENAKRKTGLEPLSTADAEKIGVKTATKD